MTIAEEISQKCRIVSRAFVNITAGCLAYIVYELLTKGGCAQGNDCKKSMLAMKIVDVTLVIAVVFQGAALVAQMYSRVHSEGVDINTEEPSNVGPPPPSYEEAERIGLPSYDELAKSGRLETPAVETVVCRRNNNVLNS